MDQHDEAATARAFWIREPGFGELRGEALRTPGPDEVLVRTRYSGVSRGTEALVFRGGVPASQHAAMRAPFQDGEFPGPVKYGYLNVGRVERGPGRARRAHGVLPVPAPGPLRGAGGRGHPRPGRGAGRAGGAGGRGGDRGERAVGRRPAGRRPDRGDRRRDGRLLRGPAAVRVARRAGRSSSTPTRPGTGSPPRSGWPFRTPEAADDDCDLVLHVSANPAGLARALQLVGDEGKVIELSWYGDRSVAVPLGEAFHARRLTIRSSQVGAVSPARRARRSHADRMAVALELLADPAFDALITGESAFAELPEIMPRLASGELPALCHRIVYPGG